MKNDGRIYTTGKYSRYKGHFLIAFYDKTGEHFINIFNNIRELLKYKGLEITRANVIKHAKYIYDDINRRNHKTRLLNGTVMTVRLIDERECDDIN